MEHYLHHIAKRRVNTREPDTSLEIIRRAIFGFFKIPEPRKRESFEQQAAKVTGKPVVKVSAEEFSAWEKAGMPSPFEGWLKGYRDAAERR
jgi:hypothetical protein